MNPFDLTGRVALVTGGYGVLGGSLADGLAAAGARIAILGRRSDAAKEKAASLRSAGAEAIALVADVLDETQLRAAAEELIGAWGSVDILVNAAGGNVQRARSDTTPVFDVPMDAFDEVLRLNLHGSVVPTMVFGEIMGRQRRGSIVNISSMAAQQALSGVLGYSIAKSGIDNLTRWMAVEMARKFGDGVRVNAIAPGWFVTDINRGYLTGAGASLVRDIPVGRFGQDGDLDGALLLLVSDAGAYMAGTTVVVDGGQMVALRG